MGVSSAEIIRDLRREQDTPPCHQGLPFVTPEKYQKQNSEQMGRIEEPIMHYTRNFQTG